MQCFDVEGHACKVSGVAGNLHRNDGHHHDQSIAQILQELRFHCAVVEHVSMHGCNKYTERIVDRGIRMVQRRGDARSIGTPMESNRHVQL